MKPKAIGYETRAVCHDHFNGSAHCVECGGWCRLTGQDLAYTALVRAVFESAAFNQQEPPYAMLKQMERSGVAANTLWLRAKSMTPR